jgi:hypothetical protein
MVLTELEQKLVEAQGRLNNLSAERFSRKLTPDEWQEYVTAKSELIALQRQVAAAKGEPYAVPIDFPFNWDTGAPLPHLITSEYRTFLTFYLSNRDPKRDGTYVMVRNPCDESPQKLALIEFHKCRSVKLGDPNDEVLHGHPLYGKGLEPYSAQIVENSPWIADLEAINKVHDYYNPDSWRRLKHFVFWFHDTTFECVAESFTVELFHESMKQLLARVCERLLE